MGNATTIVKEKLMSRAKLGLFFATMTISKNIVNYLLEQDCKVIDSKEVNYFPREHHIRWEDAKVECKDVNLLDEKSDEYSLAQRLWIISMKNQPKETK